MGGGETTEKFKKKATLFVLREKGAADWSTGIKISSAHHGRRHSIQYHHIFPKSLLKQAGYDKKEINEFANMAFIGGKTNRSITNKNPKDYLPDICKNRGDVFLTNQLVTLDKSFWDIPKYKDFLEERRKTIASGINAFLAKFD